MKRPFPTPPSGAPPGTVWFGGPIEWFSVAIIFSGPYMSPAAISAAMHLEPTREREVDKAKKIAAQWVRALKRADTDEWDVGEAMRTLVEQFPDDDSAWLALPPETQIRLSVGLALKSYNQGFSLEPDIMGWLAKRRVILDVEIYDEDRAAE